MALVTTKEMFAKAYDGGYAIGAFNVNNMEMIQGIVEAGKEEHAPLILQVSSGARKYANPRYLKKLVEAAVEDSGLPIALHLDHGDTFELCKSAVDDGFTSVMIDASALPYKRNLELTAEITKIAHVMGVSVEAGLGRLATGEAGSGESVSGKPEDFYTDPDEAAEFSEKTKIDALAVAFGTAHGFYTAQPKLDFNVVKACAGATGLPLVMHGGSGVSEEGFKKAIANGIRKINYYSYMSKAGYLAAKSEIEKNPSGYLHDVEYAAMRAMKEDVKTAFRIFSQP